MLVISFILLLSYVLLLLRFKLDIINLTCFPMDTILRILLGESYSGICVLADLSMYVNYTNKLSGAIAGETVAELTSNQA